MPPLTPPVISSGRFAESAQPALTAPGSLVLRPWTMDDVPALLAAYADPAVQRWMGFRVDFEDEAREMVKRWTEGWLAESSAHWAVVLASGDVVGRMSLRDMNLRWGRAECAYFTMPAARGAGVAPRALAGLSSWAFGRAGFHRLWLRHSAANPASCRVAVKAGFDAEGTERGSEIHPDGWHDMHVHSRIGG